MKSQKYNGYKVEKFLYKMGWICMAAALIVFLANRICIRQGIHLFVPCIWYNVVGIYCPGCGGTRAIRELIRGNILKSFYFHPFVPYAAIITFIFMASWTCWYISKGKIKGIRFQNWFLYIGITIAIIQWILKNILLFTIKFQLI